jgi:hypothetical protein
MMPPTIGDVTRHNKKKYVLNGPVDITGNEILELVQEAIGEEVKDVRFKDMSFVEDMAAQTKESKNVVRRLRYAMKTTWAGKTTVATTSKEVLEIAPPTRGLAEMWTEMLGGEVDRTMAV